MMKIVQNKITQAFSLIEVLIFVTLLSLFFVVALSVLTVSLRVSKINEHKIYAKHYADELYEWLLSEKEKDWGGDNTVADLTFTKRVSQGSKEFCFISSPIDEWSSPDSHDSCALLNNLYLRYVVFTPRSISQSDPYIDKVDVAIVVKWEESGNIYTVPINSTFSIWEKTY